MKEDEMVGWHHDLMDLSLSKLREMVKDREDWRSATVHGVAKSQTEQLNNHDSVSIYFLGLLVLVLRKGLIGILIGIALNL